MVDLDYLFKHLPTAGQGRTTAQQVISNKYKKKASEIISTIIKAQANGELKVSIYEVLDENVIAALEKKLYKVEVRPDGINEYRTDITW